LRRDEFTSVLHLLFVGDRIAEIALETKNRYSAIRRGQVDQLLIADQKE
jgi:hypothetical protein